MPKDILIFWKNNMESLTFAALSWIAGRFLLGYIKRTGETDSEMPILDSVVGGIAFGISIVCFVISFWKAL